MTVLNNPQAYKLNNLGVNPLDKLKLIQGFMTVLITCPFDEQFDN